MFNKHIYCVFMYNTLIDVQLGEARISSYYSRCVLILQQSATSGPHLPCSFSKANQSKEPTPPAPESFCYKD
ncbi:hypothetical protein Amal_00256 [Acetobacter malorum]|uniref:Uncharacterized protein n=1 Tax=Acetobacter malorum TaxID=178901 RepID=A0A177GGU2_9PROT|nr:hypothetical protein Amal_00256 [Acetobacter malorum]